MARPAVQVAGQSLLDICMKASGLMARGLIEARRLVAQDFPMEA